jgi:hypothetical protein
MKNQQTKPSFKSSKIEIPKPNKIISNDLTASPTKIISEEKQKTYSIIKRYKKLHFCNMLEKWNVKLLHGSKALQKYIDPNYK